VNGFAGFLANGAEVDEFAGGIQVNPDFLAELANGGGEWLLVVVYFTLGNRPVAVVFVFEKGPARVSQQDFEVLAAAAVEEQARADAW
jgi:hypothetical protein